MLTCYIFTPLKNITLRNIKVYLYIRYLALFISVFLNPQAMDFITRYPSIFGVIICCFFLGLNFFIYIYYKKITSNQCIFNYILERFWLNIIFLLTLIFLNFLCLYYLHRTFIDLYMGFIFVSTGGLFYDILYSTGGNVDYGYHNMASSSNTNSTSGGSGGPGGNGGGNNGGGNNTNPHNNTRSGGNTNEDEIATPNPYRTCAEALRLTAENFNVERKAKPGVESTVTLADIGVNSYSNYYPLLHSFATEYEGNDKSVRTFCRHVNRKQ